MSKVRINDLARELEVKSKEILDVLAKVGVTEKKTHSSSLEEHEAEKVRKALKSGGEGASSKSTKVASKDIKPKIDLSKISKPGDVLAAIRKQTEGTTKPEPPIAPAKTAPVSVKTVTAKAPAPRTATPPPMPEKPAIASKLPAQTVVVTKPVIAPAPKSAEPAVLPAKIVDPTTPPPATAPPPT